MALSDQDILGYIGAHPGAGREDIRRDVAPDVSAPTFWRNLKRLVDNGQLEVSGRGRATGYSLAGTAAVRAHLRMPWNQRPPAFHRKEFVDNYIPGKTFYLCQADRQRLHDAGQPALLLPARTFAQHILEQLLVDLSWASSRMEGNTYDILETERLIRFGEEAVGKNRTDVIMILNHKAAIQYIVDNLVNISICRQDILNIHALLADALLIDPAMAGQLRRLPVSITHSSYQPLYDPIQINEEFGILIEKAAAITDPFEQSFFLTVHMPYLQAFYDVNKRTSRIISNIPLLKADLAPMSFLEMNDSAYIDGLLGVYEINDVSLLREAYINAYLASARKYTSLRFELEAPAKAAAVYRDFVRQAVRRSVIEWKKFRPGDIRRMAADEGIPESDREHVVNFVGNEIRGLHEGNLVRYQLRLEDLAGMQRQST